MTQNEAPAPKTSDLGIRTVSGIVMIVIAGSALWFGGWLWASLVSAVALGVLWEWWDLVRKFGGSVLYRLTWMAWGVFYLLVAGWTLISLNTNLTGLFPALLLMGGVIATDTGAYFAGRSFGGPKIAPKISPSKTWSGLIGGIVLASLWHYAANKWAFSMMEPADLLVADGDGYGIAALPSDASLFLNAVGAGAFVAVVAQAGDFFESWMKRRAGVKDSGALIPGHGGLFDRVDGLLAVAFVTGIISLFSGMYN